jgi:hypothetical protein
MISANEYRSRRPRCHGFVVVDAFSHVLLLLRSLHLILACLLANSSEANSVGRSARKREAYGWHGGRVQILAKANTRLVSCSFLPSLCMPNMAQEDVGSSKSLSYQA